MNENDQARGLLAIELTDKINESARSIISDELDQYNIEYTKISDNTPLDVLISESTTGKTIGGLVGRTSLGIFFISYLYIPATLRKQGYGAKVLQIAEMEAARRGCSEAVLFTMAIQAPGFYEKQGYMVFGHIDCTPPGNARIFMRKKLHFVG